MYVVETNMIAYDNAGLEFVIRTYYIQIVSSSSDKANRGTSYQLTSGRLFQKSNTCTIQIFSVLPKKLQRM